MVREVIYETMAISVLDTGEAVARKNARECAEKGLVYVTNPDSDEETRQKGIFLIMAASRQRDSWANYCMACLIKDGLVEPVKRTKEQAYKSYLYRSASLGNENARLKLNEYCKKQYEKRMLAKDSIVAAHNRMLADRGMSRPLTYYDGKKRKEIKINRTGIQYPIDAVLKNENGKNTLYLSMDISVVDYDSLPNIRKIEKAIERGIREWEGVYEVFNGQRVEVKIDITMNEKLVDTVTIIPMAKAAQEMVKAKGKNSEILGKSVEQERSMATSLGLKKGWSAKGRKMIFLYSGNGKFDDYSYLSSVIKHEIGHSLGLGDLYRSEEDNMQGVAPDLYEELIDFYVDGHYNLVMDDEQGVISNNDIEMVILAFWKNEIQLYQKVKAKDKLSDALGKDN